MKYIYTLALAALLSTQATAANNDSVYSWGAWAQNIQPAAGPTAQLTPASVTSPDVNFRPNENAAFNRAAGVNVAVTTSTPTPTETANPNIVIVPTTTQSSLISDL